MTRARPEIDFGVGLRPGKGSISDFGNRRQLHLRITGDRRQKVYCLFFFFSNLFIFHQKFSIFNYFLIIFSPHVIFLYNFFPIIGLPLSLSVCLSVSLFLSLSLSLSLLLFLALSFWGEGKRRGQASKASKRHLTVQVSILFLFPF